MEIQIQALNLSHSETVQKLSEQLGYSLSIHQIQENVKEILDSEDHIALVAIDSEIVVGWIHAFKAMFIESRPFIEIGGLVVDENYRGKGIGKKLINEIKRWCIEKNILSLRVRSQIKRKEAHEFYLNVGFGEIKEQKVFQMNL